MHVPDDMLPIRLTIREAEIFRGARRQTISRLVKPALPARCHWDSAHRVFVERGYAAEHARRPPIELGERRWVQEMWRCNEYGGRRIEFRAGGSCLEFADWQGGDGFQPFEMPTTPHKARIAERQLAGEKVPDPWRHPASLPRWAARRIVEAVEVRPVETPWRWQITLRWVESRA